MIITGDMFYVNQSVFGGGGASNVKDLKIENGELKITYLDGTTATFSPTDLKVSSGSFTDQVLKLVLSDSSEITIDLSEFTTVAEVADALASYVTTDTFNTHKNDTDNPHAVTKAQVGLGNVDNTSDEDKKADTLQDLVDKKAILVSNPNTSYGTDAVRYRIRTDGTIEEALETSADMTADSWIEYNKQIRGGDYPVDTWQEAIDFIEALSNYTITNGNVVVILPAGTLTATQVLDLRDVGAAYNRIVIRGAGEDDTIIKNTDDNDKQIMVVSNSWVQVEKLTFDFDNKNKNIVINKYSDIVFTSTVKLKNSVGPQAIYVSDRSKLYARKITIENCKIGITATHRSYIDIREAAISVTGTGSTGVSVDRNTYLYAYETKITGTADTDYGVAIQNMSNAYMPYAEITKCKIAVLLNYGAICNASYIKFKGAIQYGIRSYTDCFFTASYLESTLDIAEGIRHVHADKSTVYLNKAKLTNGQRIAHVHYGTRFQFYNAPSDNLVNINDGTNDNYISVNNLSWLQDSGSDINSNIPNASSVELYGTRF